MVDVPAAPLSGDELWVILGDRQDIAKKIATQFPRTQLVYLGEAFSQADDQPWHVHPDHFEQLFRQLEQTNIAGIIHCWSLDADIDNLAQSQWLSNYTTLKLIQTLHDQQRQIPCWLVTRDAQKVIDQDQVAGFAGGSLWGLGQAIALEHPELWGGLIDIDAALPDFVALTQSKMQHLAIRGGTVYAATLKPQVVPKAESTKIIPEVAYLVTGGLGNIGRQVAQWLDEAGATKIILLSRRQPNADDLAALNLPASAIVYPCDIAKEAEVRTLFHRFPNILGIFHAAGTLADGLLQGQTWAQFQDVFVAKVQGTWNLHRCSEANSLDFFVLFSSVAAAIGSPGQGNYGAANGFMAAIAQYRQAQGLPALAINWGPWAAGGMATALKNQGMAFIQPDQGIEMLARLLPNQGTIGVFKPDWPSLARQFPQLTQSHYFKAVLTQCEQRESSSIFERLMGLSVVQRKSALFEYLRQAIAQILKLDIAQIQDQDNLLDLGMDSLMIMEAITKLKQDLQLMLYPREIYERPRLDVLAAYLTEEFLKAHDPDSASVTTTKTTTPIIQRATTTWHKPQQKNPQPIAFILSSPRSGSTLLRVMLAGHPALYSPPELHLLPFETMGDRQAELGLSHLGEGLQRALMDLDNLSAEASQAKVEQWVADNRSIADIYAYLQTKAAGRLLIDKSPSYGSDRHILDHSEILFDNAKYIHLVRHPYAVIESFARLRMDKLLGAQSSDPYGLAESIWAQSNRNVLALANQVSNDQYLQIVYEDLVRNPHATMTQICEFLGVDLDESVLNPYGGDRLTDGLHQQSMGVGDPNFLQHKTIDPQLAEKWRDIKLPNRLQTSTRHLAETLQYELPHDDKSAADIEYKMTERIAQVRGINYCLCEWGNPEKPLVLLLHGILEQGASWQLIAPQIAAQGYRVVAPDLRGHGKSDHAQSYSMLDFLADVDALAKRLTDEPFTLVGHSMGSVIGAMYAGIRQAQVTQLFLVETIVPNDINDAETANHLTTHLDYLATPPEHPLFPDVAIAARRLRQATPQLSEELSEALVERSTVAVDDGVQWRWDAFLRTRAGIEFNGISRRRYLALLEDIQAKITLIYGNKSEFNRPADLDVIRAAMPNAERLTVSGGHNLHFENPQAIADILIQYLS